MERLAESVRPCPAADPKRGRPCASLLAFRSRSRPRRTTGAIVTDVLVLNFTYEALNITSFQRAVKLLF
ncbi:MAG TPA: hypothetical protein VFF00_06590, partial [Candidatus Elarobacter sp.]|nr:hypothetical protein [Candidatus Elarobacter sp.]